jgi:hypothetical protein
MSDTELLEEYDVTALARKRVGGGRAHDPGPDDDYFGRHAAIFASAERQRDLHA